MRERRYFVMAFRAAALDDVEAPEGVLRGYASVYDVQYRIGYNLKEEIAPAAFRDSLAAADGIIPIFYMHDWDNPIGYAKATEDAHGVHVEATLFIADNERARSVWLAAKAGALREWSIGFYPSTVEMRTDEESGQEVERVTEGDLAEASVVVRGANPVTSMLEVRGETVVHRDEPEPESVELPAHLLDNLDKPHVRALVQEIISQDV